MGVGENGHDNGKSRNLKHLFYLGGEASHIAGLLASWAPARPNLRTQLLIRPPR